MTQREKIKHFNLITKIIYILKTCKILSNILASQSSMYNVKYKYWKALNFPVDFIQFVGRHDMNKYNEDIVTSQNLFHKYTKYKTVEKKHDN